MRWQVWENLRITETLSNLCFQPQSDPIWDVFQFLESPYSKAQAIMSTEIFQKIHRNQEDRICCCRLNCKSVCTHTAATCYSADVPLPQNLKSSHKTCSMCYIQNERSRSIRNPLAITHPHLDWNTSPLCFTLKALVLRQQYTDLSCSTLGHFISRVQWQRAYVHTTRNAGEAQK